MRTPATQSRAFTIVELLVVIAVISLLMGLILPAISGVQKRSAKNAEMNSIKQVGYAWQMYGTNHNDAALPGFLTPEVQSKWKVKYDYPTAPTSATDKTIPPAPTYSAGQPNVAGPWTWRLLPYLDYNHKMVHGHVDEDNESIIAMVEEAEEVALEPGFGYNGYYIGGYWDPPVAVDGVMTAFHKYYDDCGVTDGRRLVIPLALGQIKNSSKMITFCSTSMFDAPGLYGRFEDDMPGGHLSGPPIIRQENRWSADPGDVTAVNVVAPYTYAPMGRYTGQASVLWADGHCDTQAANALEDQRLWISSANARDYKHDVCPAP